eukprot:6190370-Pleurochrysis_carterae.AAC.2
MSATAAIAIPTRAFTCTHLLQKIAASCVRAWCVGACLVSAAAAACKVQGSPSSVAVPSKERRALMKMTK